MWIPMRPFFSARFGGLSDAASYVVNGVWRCLAVMPGTLPGALPEIRGGVPAVVNGGWILPPKGLFFWLNYRLLPFRVRRSAGCGRCASPHAWGLGEDLC
jgi:hypothetical protein